ncbi:hypothetical protein LIER_08554 [Lithospermum erythrorhizon]|uniref:Uncharacterized protein n=1 Tax=Lithospermum erythrorhizon TaxID=34254 RepID=A0AAV3PDK6_LITER
MNNNKFSCDDQTTPHCITNGETQFQIDQFSSSDKGGGHGDISYDNYLNNSPIKSSIFEPNPPQTFTEGVQNCNPICCPQTTSTSITNTLTISHAHRQPSSGSDELQPTKEPVGCDEQINFTEDLQENGDLSDNESENICLIKGHWTFEEDRRLTKLVEEFGDKNWQKISKGMFGTRLGKQCRERWVNHLCSDIKASHPWLPNKTFSIMYEASLHH